MGDAMIYLGAAAALILVALELWSVHRWNAAMKRVELAPKSFDILAAKVDEAEARRAPKEDA
jgi:hypothetical protein